MEEVTNHPENKGLIAGQWAPLEKDRLDYVSLPTEPGDALFFDSYVMYHTDQNQT